MDIDLLAKMVKEAILDHDSVTLPGVGCFVAELVPSTFSDKGYTINPPYRRLYFSPKQGGDTYLVDLYARDNEGVDADMATRILTEFLAEMKEVLKVKKTVVFPGLGRLRATRENHFFFVADEDLDIYPEGLGLAPLSLKTHVETPEEVATAVAGLAELIEEIPGQAGNDEKEPMPEPESVEEISPRATLGRNDKDAELGRNDKEGPESEPVQEAETETEPEPIPESEVVPEPEEEEEIPGQAGNDEKEPEPEPVEEISPRAALGRNDKDAVLVQNDKEATLGRNDKDAELDRNDKDAELGQNDKEEPEPKKSHRKFWRIVLIILGVLLALLLVLVLLSRIAPGLLDPLLYSKEELQILRYQ